MKLDKQCPDSLFILNYRDFDKWVKSRVNHNAYLLHSLREFGDKSKVLSAWKSEYYSHLKDVKEYFSGKSNFLDLNIDEMGGDDLGKFLQFHGFSIT